jgi:hypothetical protein
VGSEAEATWCPPWRRGHHGGGGGGGSGERGGGICPVLGNPWTPWLGTWVSVSSYLDDPAMEAAYAAVVAEATKTGQVLRTPPR